MMSLPMGTWIYFTWMPVCAERGVGVLRRKTMADTSYGRWHCTAGRARRQRRRLQQIARSAHLLRSPSRVHVHREARRVLRRVDVAKRFVDPVDLTHQRLGDVFGADGWKKFTNGVDAATQCGRHVPPQAAGIDGMQRLDVAIPARDDGVLRRQPARQKRDRFDAQERHVARHHEGVWLANHAEAGVDAGQWATAGKLVGGHLDVETRILLRPVADHNHLRKAVSQQIQGAREHGLTADGEKGFVGAAHAGVLATCQNDGRHVVPQPMTVLLPVCRAHDLRSDRGIPTTPAYEPPARESIARPRIYRVPGARGVRRAPRSLRAVRCSAAPGTGGCIAATRGWLCRHRRTTPHAPTPDAPSNRTTGLPPTPSPGYGPRPVFRSPGYGWSARSRRRHRARTAAD